MKYLVSVLSLWFIIAMLVLPALSQTDPSKARKFKTVSEMVMYNEADFHSKRIGNIPPGIILKSLEETRHYGGYIKVTYKDKTGWLLKAELERYMDNPAPEFFCVCNGYKIIGNTYRYFFCFHNDGTLPYAGKATLRLFDEQGNVIHSETTDFSVSALTPGHARSLYIDTAVEAPTFGLQNQDGRSISKTGELIERVKRW